MKFCIDAGHNYSGADSGAAGIGGLREQDVTFAIASALEDILVADGQQALMTRNSPEESLGTDVASSLRERVRISNEWGSDVFISIHCNSATSSAQGTEVLISGRGGLAERYGEAVQASISEKLNMVNRGVRVDTEYLGMRLYVLHNTNCPAILIETGFITNNADAEKLSAQPGEFARAIASAFGIGEGSATRFSDIENHWARIHIEKLEAYGVVNGYEDGTFRPDGNITRGEAAVMISNALSILGK